MKLDTFISAIVLLVTCFSDGHAVAIRSRQIDRMRTMMEMKMQQREKAQALGAFAGSAKYKPYQQKQACTNGKAGSGVNNTYTCDKIDLYSFIPHDLLGSTTAEGNDIWGWTSSDGREIAAVGQTDGTAFVEILKDGRSVYLGRLPTQTKTSIWRALKVINGYVYIGSEAENHGLQVFDMRKLLSIKPQAPKTFDIKTDLTAWFGKFGHTHNIVANEENNMIYAVGSNRCSGGSYMVDVSNPAKPKHVGCVSEDDYVHDAQCVIYKGPDKKYRGREICFNYDLDSLAIHDITDRSTPKLLSNSTYEGFVTIHQGWLVSDAHTHLVSDDEFDELASTNQGIPKRTTTYIWDITSLNKPKQTGFFQSTNTKTTDHNQFVLNGKSYQSNYASGLRIVDVSGIPQDPTGKSVRQLGFFDCHPEDDEKEDGEFDFVGSWSNYPYFKSGFLIVNSIERGVFVVKYTG